MTGEGRAKGKAFSRRAPAGRLKLSFRFYWGLALFLAGSAVLFMATFIEKLF